MDTRTRLVAIGALVVVVLVALFGVIFYLVKASKGGVSQPDSTSPLQRLPTISTPSPSLTPTPRGGSSTTKTYTGKAFTLTYPANWGLLTCSNSQSIELDPGNGQNLAGVVCDVAIKPVTIAAVSRLNCAGDTVTLGSHQVIKSKTTASDGITTYRWCLTVGGQSLDVTDRVSNSGARATSKIDYSKEVEQIITNIVPSPRGS